MELWKDIKGFENLYKISNYGNVFSVRKGIIMKPYDNKGYLRINLSKEQKCIKKLIHVLVAEHFISEKPFKDAQVNHKDLNKKNNHIDNLEWVTQSENIKHAIKNLNLEQFLKDNMSKIGKKYHKIGSELSKKPVAQIDIKTNTIIKIFESAREASRQTGAKYKNISQVCKNEKKSHYGFGWRFIDKEGATTIENTSNDDGSE